MFEYIKGKLIEKDPQKVILDVNGIGYKIFIPSSIYPNINEENLLLYVAYIVKEDSQTLYGFLTKLQRDIFNLVTTVSGIGAKTAIQLLGHLDIENLHLAITNADTRIISKVPGIGKKTAERLIVELKDKFKNLNKKYSKVFSNEKDSIACDAIAALINLGYNPSQARTAVKDVLQDIKEKPNLSSVISLALKNNFAKK